MSVLIPVANGSESLEVVSLVNVLRRADIEVCVASIEDDLRLQGTRGIDFMADSKLAQVSAQSFDAIILPGGEQGSRALGGCSPLIERLTQQRIEHRWYGAICAAPALALSPNGLLDGKQATCHPVFREALLHFVDQAIVIDGHCMTSQGAGTALPFALAWVEQLAGAEMRAAVSQGMCLAD